jgi:hypothetical protein
MESQVPENSIELIFIQPYTDKACIYTINDNTERHIMEIEKMISFASGLIGRTYTMPIHDLMYEFRYFVINTIDKEIIELKPDIDKERREFYKEYKKKQYDVNELKKVEKVSMMDSYNNMYKRTDIYKGLWKGVDTKQ